MVSLSKRLQRDTTPFFKVGSHSIQRLTFFVFLTLSILVKAGEKSHENEKQKKKTFSNETFYQLLRCRIFFLFIGPDVKEINEFRSRLTRTLFVTNIEASVGCSSE